MAFTLDNDEEVINVHTVKTLPPGKADADHFEGVEVNDFRSAIHILRDHTRGYVTVVYDRTGVVPADSAIVAAMTQAFASADPKQNVRVHIPAGKCLITESALLNLWTGSTPYRFGVTFSGDGVDVTTIVFRPTSTAYLYDGVSVPGRRFMYATFRDLTVLCDSSTAGGTVSLFRQYGHTDGYPDQAFTFAGCRFDADPDHAGNLLRIEGTFNGSENKFLFCRGYHWQSVISCANEQAVNQYVVGSDFELTRGHIFHFTAGGQLTVLGGSYILGNDANEFGGSLLRLESGAGGIAGTFNFYGVRTEVYDPTAKVYHLTGQNLGATVNVVGGAHRVLVNADCVLARVNSFSSARVFFSGCDLVPNSHNNKIEFENTQGTPGWYFALASAGSVVIENSSIAEDLCDHVTWGANAEGGVFRTRNCTAGGPVAVEDPATALDWDMTGKGGVSGRHANPVRVKSASGFVAYWPNSTPAWAALGKIKLPSGSVLKSIHVRKANKGDGDASSYQLAVTNGDGSHTYGTSVLGTRGAQHDVHVEDIHRTLISENVTNHARQSSALGTSPWIAGPPGTVTATNTSDGDGPYSEVAKADGTAGANIQASPVGGVPLGSVTLSFDVRATATSDKVGAGVWTATGYNAWTAAIMSGPGTLSAPSGAGTTTPEVTGLSTTLWTRVSYTTTIPNDAPAVVIAPDGFLSTTVGAAVKVRRVQLQAGTAATGYISTTTDPVTEFQTANTIVQITCTTGNFGSGIVQSMDVGDVFFVEYY
jgi:hypothetical protein